MTSTTLAFLEQQKASANNPVGSHQARSRGIAIKTAKADQNAANAMADEISSNLEAASAASGFHPDSCHRLAVWLRDWRKAL